MQVQVFENKKDKKNTLKSRRMTVKMNSVGQI
jgi:hypothetical protein